MIWLLLGLLTAIFFTAHHIVSKRIVAHARAEYVAHAQLLAMSLAATPFLPFVWSQLNISGQALVGLVVLGGVIFGASILYMKSLQAGSLSKTVPLLTLTPIFTIPIAFVLVGELPGARGILGVLVIVLGTYILNSEKLSVHSLLSPFKAIISNTASRYMFYVAVIYGLGSALNKYVIVNSSVLLMILGSAFFGTGFQAIYLWLRDRKQYITRISGVMRLHLKGVLAIALLDYMVITAQFIGMSLTYASYIIALKRTTALFSVLAGYIFFNEKKNVVTSLCGVITMLIGLTLLVL